MSTGRKPRTPHLDDTRLKAMVRDHLANEGVSLRAFCIAAGVDDSNTGAWLRGKHGVSRATVAKLARAMGVEPASLYRDPDADGEAA